MASDGSDPGLDLLFVPFCERTDPCGINHQNDQLYEWSIASGCA